MWVGSEEAGQDMTWATKLLANGVIWLMIYDWKCTKLVFCCENIDVRTHPIGRDMVSWQRAICSESGEIKGSKDYRVGTTTVRHDHIMGWHQQR